LPIADDDLGKELAMGYLEQQFPHHLKSNPIFSSTGIGLSNLRNGGNNE